MDLTSIIGVVIGVVLIVFVGIGPKDLGNFLGSRKCGDRAGRYARICCGELPI